MLKQNLANAVWYSDVEEGCKGCALFGLCAPVGPRDTDGDWLAPSIVRERQVRRGQHLFRVGEPFVALHAVKSGCLKSYTYCDSGREDITGFYIPGELLGADAIYAGRHSYAAKALADSTLCELPFALLMSRINREPALQRQLVKLMSRAMLHTTVQFSRIGRKRSEARVAAFLLDLASRLGAANRPGAKFDLPMSRTDIGKYLNITLETVCRIFARFQAGSLIGVDKRRVSMLDKDRLQAVADNPMGMGEV